jgi:hypothetical protein
MSITHKFTVSTAINRAAADHPARVSITGVQVHPRKDDKVSLQATTGVIAACVMEPGTGDRPVAINGSLLKIAGKHIPTCELNGKLRIEKRKGKNVETSEHANPIAEGRAPNISVVIPSDVSEYRAVNINLAKMAKLIEALSKRDADETYATLFVRDAESPMLVLTDGGDLGVVMYCNSKIDPKQEWAKAREAHFPADHTQITE